MRVLTAVLKVLAGVVTGLVISELVFRARDDGAFPHLNLYAEDPALGVRLVPNAEMRLKLGTNPTTTIHTNAAGFRGADWGPPSKDEVLVVGDSQVFGLGVEDGETFSAQLAAVRKVTVVNAGVPTYGPEEYTALVERLVAERKPKHVVYVLNLANDLFELGKPNASRHKVWDGWAVRSETAPASVTPFPFRHAVMNRSHLVYAARRFASGPVNLAQESAGEGTWKDIVSASSTVTPFDDEAATRDALVQRRRAAKALDELQQKLDTHVSDRVSEDERFAAEAVKAIPALTADDPRDIVQVPFLEGARPVQLTAHQLYLAALGMQGNDEKLLAIARRLGDASLTALLEERKGLRGELAATLTPQARHAPTPLEALLKRTNDTCARAGSSLLVVALPLDVMVSKEEWRKYGREPIDLSVTQVLLDDVVARALAVGATALDPTEALRGAQPGAFLDGDLHLTPKGHRALAEAIHAALEHPKVTTGPLTLPEGRSWPPTDDEWRAVAEVTVKGSTAARCETKQVREWFQMTCRDGDTEGDPKPLRIAGIAVTSGGHGDVLLGGTWRARSVLLPVLPGDTATLTVSWEDHTRTLTLEHPADGPPRRALSEPAPKKRQPRGAWADVDVAGRPCRAEVCEGTEWSNPLRDVACPEGRVAAGALKRCATPCSATRPCEKGTCHPWPTGAFCGVP